MARRAALGMAVASMVGVAGPACAESLTITGQTGPLGEWELTATVVRAPNDARTSWSGPLTLKHTGFCGVDEPEVRTGELRIESLDPLRDVAATLLIDGAACTFKGRRRVDFEGVLTCPGKRDVRMMLAVE